VHAGGLGRWISEARTGAARVSRVRALGVASRRVQRRASCAGDGEEGSDRGEGEHFGQVYRNDAYLSGRRVFEA
jgi:hypothetical protein